MTEDIKAVLTMLLDRVTKLEKQVRTLEDQLNYVSLKQSQGN